MATPLLARPPVGATSTNIDDGDRRLYTVAGFCRTYSVGKTTAYKLINTGLVEAVRYGGRTLIRGESAERWAGSLPAFEPRSRAVRQ